MTTSAISLSERLEALSSDTFQQALTGIRRGVEREALRINPNGSLASTPHPQALGSALTHDSITTDFSESLLEFITPPETDVEVTFAQLNDIHKYVLSNIGSEKLWPLSMPCFVENEDEIPLAYFGESNVGKMKRVYRLGLKNRYGSMMQAISGVHFNFSLPDTFWQAWASLHDTKYTQDQVSADYFSMIRNYRRLCWLIPYLYGASPALCGSFLNGKSHQLPFETLGKGTYYLPYATSLRMSDLGYTNAEQSALQICYNQLDNYVRLLRSAMETKSTRFEKFSAGEEGHWQQLSHNILQIENELYSPIRPKQPTHSMEKPTDALVRRGINYIEVRALDVNPFAAVGIDEGQFAFLDVFLLSCLLLPSAEMTPAGLDEASKNMNTMVLEGRKPGVMLHRDGNAVAMHSWAAELFDTFTRVAALLDSAHKTDRYSAAVKLEWERIENPALTLSGQIMDRLKKNNEDNGAMGLQLASQYQADFADWQYTYQDEDTFRTLAAASLDAQKAVEEADDKDFDTFIRDYFSEPPAKKNA